MESKQEYYVIAVPDCGWYEDTVEYFSGMTFSSWSEGMAIPTTVTRIDSGSVVKFTDKEEADKICKSLAETHKKYKKSKYEVIICPKKF